MPLQCAFLCIYINVCWQILQHNDLQVYCLYLNCPPYFFSSPEGSFECIMLKTFLSEKDRQASISCSFDSLTGWLVGWKDPWRNTWGDCVEDVERMETNTFCALSICSPSLCTYTAFSPSLKKHSSGSDLRSFSLGTLTQTKIVQQTPLSHTLTFTLNHIHWPNKNRPMVQKRRSTVKRQSQRRRSRSFLDICPHWCLNTEGTHRAQHKGTTLHLKVTYSWSPIASKSCYRAHLSWETSANVFRGFHLFEVLIRENAPAAPQWCLLNLSRQASCQAFSLLKPRNQTVLSTHQVPMCNLEAVCLTVWKTEGSIFYVYENVKLDPNIAFLILLQMKWNVLLQQHW